MSDSRYSVKVGENDGSVAIYKDGNPCFYWTKEEFYEDPTLYARVMEMVKLAYESPEEFHIREAISNRVKTFKGKVKIEFKWDDWQSIPAETKALNAAVEEVYNNNLFKEPGDIEKHLMPKVSKAVIDASQGTTLLRHLILKLKTLGYPKENSIKYIQE